MFKHRTLYHAIGGAMFLSLAACTADSGYDTSARTTAYEVVKAEEGMHVIGPDGREIGEVDEVIGDQVIVALDGYSATGDRAIAVDRSQLRAVRNGADIDLQLAQNDYRDPDETREFGTGDPFATPGTERSDGDPPPGFGELPE